MGKMNKKLAGIALLSMLTASSAWALPYGGTGPGAALQDVLKNITLSNDSGCSTGSINPADGEVLNPCTSSIDVTTDSMASDGYWNITGSGGSISTMIIELAGYANTNVFGVYNNGDYVTLFNGPASQGTTTPTQATLSFGIGNRVVVNGVDSGIDFASTQFGFFLNSTAAGGNSGLWHSDTNLNSDGIDHMATYRGNDIDRVSMHGSANVGTWTSNEYVLAWEDLDCSIGCDGDYTDFVVMVESIEVPAPATLALLGLGLLGMGFRARRKAA